MFSLSKIINLGRVGNVINYTHNEVKRNYFALKNYFNIVVVRSLKTLHQKYNGEYIFKLAKPCDTLRIMNFLRQNYAHNSPFFKCLNLDLNIPNPALEELWLNTILQGYTLIAEEKLNTNLLGVIVNRKLCAWDADQLDHLATCISCYQTRKLLHLFALIQREPNLHKKSYNEKVFDMSLLIVNKETDGTLERNLIEQSLNFGRNIGFRIASINCTNEKMAKYAKLSGMDLIWKFPYDRILDNNSEPIIKAEIPQTHARVFSIELK